MHLAVCFFDSCPGSFGLRLLSSGVRLAVTDTGTLGWTDVLPLFLLN